MFDGAKLKIERANHHIGDLERQFAAFVEAHPHTLSIQSNPQTGQPTVRIRFSADPPKTLALIVGDAIHNLRTALDHMTWELVGRDGGTQNRYLKLPTGDNRINFEAACRGIKTPSQSIIDLFLSLEVFPTGKGESLYATHLLDNADKHTVITPIVRASRLSKLVALRADGSLAMSITNTAILGGSGPYANITDLPPGVSVEIDKDTKATPDIFFGDVEPVKSQPIIPTLSQLSEIVSKTIDITERSIT